MLPTAFDLTRELLRHDTVNPPGDELDCALRCGALLERAGFTVRHHDLGERRASIVATLPGRDGTRPLALTGHLDVVPLGAVPWRHDAFAGETDGARLYGRGSSDMKSGVAAMVLAACALGPKISKAGGAGLELVLTASEEDGCIGSARLLESGLLGHAGALLVGEPTANAACVGHKGTLKFRAHFRGVTAHGSMPQLGDNAVHKAARAVLDLAGFDFGVPPHPVMGRPTLNVGTIEGGLNVNSVPDRAAVGVDVRTVPGIDHCALCGRLRALFPADTELEIIQDAEPVYTEPADAWVAQVLETTARITGERAPEAPGTLAFYTDAGNLRRAYGAVPTVILGPGEPSQAHQTDEWCGIERIGQSQAIYEALIARWCGA